jgi:branched-subunit amino acid aminotransferase/4-amino-4-deoxychorismate lyase
MPADLERADEVFIASTTRNLLPVVDLDGRPIPHSGPGMRGDADCVRRLC